MLVNKDLEMPAKISSLDEDCVAFGDAIQELLFLRHVWCLILLAKGMSCSRCLSTTRALYAWRKLNDELDLHIF